MPDSALLYKKIRTHPGNPGSMYSSKIVMGGMTAENPGMATVINGCSIVFHRSVLAQLGFMDPRFGHYGHEHTEMTFRAIRAGYGGVVLRQPAGDHHLFKVIEGGLKLLPAATHGTEADAQANGEIMSAIKDGPIYRHAWRDDEEMVVFLSEQENALLAQGKPSPNNRNVFSSTGVYGRFRQEQGLDPVPESPFSSRPDNISFGKSALQSSHCQWSFAPTAAQDAARAVNGIIDGTRKFHTDIEDNPWWQVDLGGIATITEVHVHNTRDFTWNRLTAFSIGASIDGESWVTLAEHHGEPPREAPFIWAGPGTAWARFVRVTLLGRNFLHLDQVEVFGRL